MNKDVKITNPRYQQIAVDVAAKIANKQYLIGQKIYARSALASQYGVSAETARRAICVLTDMDIVETTKGSGVLIKSYENAVKFINQYSEVKNINELKGSILEKISKQIEQNISLKEEVVELVDKANRLKQTNPFMPFEILLEKHMTYIGKTISDINFWHNTNATIIGIKRGNELLLSPGPYAVLTENDILYFVGKEECYERVINFLNDK